MTGKKIIEKNEFLKPENMVLLYARGAFPMADDSGEINWYMPETRTIIPLDSFNVPRSVRKFMESTDFEYRFDYQTEEIIRNCAEREKTWISPELIKAYKGLLQQNHLHSVGVYRNNRLIGGLFGVTYRGAFFGESMFSKVSQASKTALVTLVKHLRKRKFVLLDVQFLTPHLKMFGAEVISFEEYMELLIGSYSKDVSF